ncbi:hypothetical protein ACFWV1_26315 [Streptomyces sp. NPDC058700]|uniref:hypothetical protein n=1 Tax=Streptomyces sp. NPDC058700 TaxID=3346607 RepID=UPI0036609CF5
MIQVRIPAQHEGVIQLASELPVEGSETVDLLHAQLQHGSRFPDGRAARQKVEESPAPPWRERKPGAVPVLRQILGCAGFPAGRAPAGAFSRLETVMARTGLG